MPRRGGPRAFDRPAGSLLTAWCGGPGADHGRKHEAGDGVVTRGTLPPTARYGSTTVAFVASGGSVVRRPGGRVARATRRRRGRAGCAAGRAGRRRGGSPGPTSGRGPARPGGADQGFWGRRRVRAVADGRQHGEGEHHQRDVAGPAVPAPGLVVVHPEPGLGGL